MEQEFQNNRVEDGYWNYCRASCALLETCIDYSTLQEDRVSVNVHTSIELVEERGWRDIHRIDSNESNHHLYIRILSHYSENAYESIGHKNRYALSFDGPRFVTEVLSHAS